MTLVANAIVMTGTLWVLQGCAPAGPDVVIHTAERPIEGPCPIDGLRSELAEEVERLRLTITAPDMAEPIVAEAPVGAPLTADEVPIGDGRVVGLFGLAGKGASWRGVTRDVSVREDEETLVDVLVTRIADVSCARSGDDAKRAFHTATPLPDGRILVVGGASSVSPCGEGCRRYAATPSASLYDPRTGTFTRTNPLAVPRMFHTATALDDGRVVIAGGAREIEIRTAADGGVDPAFPFPIAPGGAAGVVLGSIEIFDPATARFTGAGDDPAGPRLFAAATALPNGEVLITGGIPDLGAPRHDLSNAMRSTTVCGGEPVTCRAGPPMALRRAGHAAFVVEDDVIIWGGAVEQALAGDVELPHLERLRGSSFQVFPVARMQAERNVFFAATAQYLPFRLLAAGGLVRGADGTFALASTEVDGQLRGAVYIFDAAHSEGVLEGGIAVGPVGGARMHLPAPRFLAAAAPLSASRAVIAGGFTDLALTPSNALELFEQEEVAVRPVSSGGTPRLLHQARGGLAAATTGDGNVLFVGGEAGGASLQTAEIFADPRTPAGVAP